MAQKLCKVPYSKAHDGSLHMRLEQTTFQLPVLICSHSMVEHMARSPIIHFDAQCDRDPLNKQTDTHTHWPRAHTDIHTAWDKIWISFWRNKHKLQKPNVYGNDWFFLNGSFEWLSWTDSIDLNEPSKQTKWMWVRQYWTGCFLQLSQTVVTSL